jgi:mono/diheme cytochrome c family protein
MKYFFLSLIIISVLVLGIFGFRGRKSTSAPIEIFPDMDRQDKVLSQKPSNFFRDSMGSRLPVPESLPHASDDGVFPIEFGAGMLGYYYTGTDDDYWGNGLPEELALGAENIEAFLRRGESRYSISCTPCHGMAGDGKGIASYYGVPGIANLHTFPRTMYPDGKMFDVITHGKGGMGGYGAALPVRDRWAIIAYVRALQTAFKTPVAESGTQDSPTASN